MVVIIVVVVFAIVSMLTYKAWADIAPEILPEVNNSNESVTVINEMSARMPSVFDGGIITAFILLWALVLVASFMIDSHPIFFIFTLILMVFICIVGILVGNFYEEMFTDPDLSALPILFPMTNWLLTHLLIVGIVVGASIMLVLFGKNQLA